VEKLRSKNGKDVFYVKFEEEQMTDFVEKRRNTMPKFEALYGRCLDYANKDNMFHKK
jgi:hypothetical protein